MSKPAISIIGMGNVGSALNKACEKAGYKVKSLFNRSASSNIFVKEGLPESCEDLGELIFITVSDQAIEEVTAQLAELKGSLKGRSVAHCSGTLPSSVLSKAGEKGASVGTFHPMMAVKPDTDSFEGIYFDGEGGPACLEILSKLSVDLNARFLIVDPVDKKFLHAASVMASNYLVTLADMASSVGSRTGLPKEQVLKALLPLMKSTIRNLEGGDSRKALTGPIERGDQKVIEEHLNILSDSDNEYELYRVMGLHTLELVDEDTRNRLMRLFLKNL